MRRLTIEEAELRYPDMCKSQVWVTTKTKYWFKCKQHGKYLQRFNDHARGNRCPICGGTKKLTIEEAEARFSEMIKGQIWINDSTKYWFKCKTHGKYIQTFNSHRQGNGCHACGLASRSALRQISIEEAEARHPDMYKGQIWTGNHSKYLYKCKTHGKYLQAFNAHDQGDGCPLCSTSKGEKKVLQILESLKFSFSRQFRNPKCRSKRPLPFDFSVWNKGKLHLIEFHGEQHYKPARLFGQIKFKEQQYRDNIKKNFCKNNGIPLLIIKYNEKNIESTIKNFLK